MLKTKDLYDLTHTRAAALLEGTEYPWEVLSKIKETILEIGKNLPKDEFNETQDDAGNPVWIAKDAKIYPSNYIAGPTIIGHATEVRPGVFIRGSALVGDNCVVGNSTELKNVILFDNVQVPHYNYVGDSVLGYKSHMGAGSITSNVKSDKKLVVVKNGDEKIETGLKKMGAMLGDRVEVGCNSVLNPGTVIGRDSNVYPTSCVRGMIPEGCIWKNTGKVVVKTKD
ncbi:MAG: UDP-N-acetylglucosamine pyrophosphorylase [Clostridia bacterium]|nr:UDP-N-acetylglucosamine pyrophosphorylase [Clostridia bacterium]